MSDSVHLPSDTTVSQFFRRELTGVSADGTITFRVIDLAVKNGAVYAAIERVENGVREITANVVRFSRTRGFFNLNYKRMDEQEGPFYTSCPARILDLLTPTDHEYALRWRAACRAQITARDEAPKLPANTIVRFEQPINFGKHGQHTDFVATSRRGVFQSLTDRGLYRIPNASLRPLRILSREEAGV